MQTKVFSENDLSEYQRLLDSRQLRLDIYYNPDFLSIDASLQGGRLEIFCGWDDKDVFIYPYIKLPFSEDDNLLKNFSDFQDITAPYGYCGPFCTDEVLFDKCESAFLEYAKSSNIVSEFVRYHHENTFLFKKNISNIYNRDILVLPLEKDFDQIWMKQFSGTNRNLIRRMEKDGFEFDISRESSDIEEFISMYFETMKNVEATQFYYFPKDYFFKLFEKLKDHIQLGFIHKDGIKYCGILFFFCNGYMTYFLSARKVDAGRIPGNNFALFKFIKLGHERSYRTVNLGGGNSMSPDDPLFKFKSNFTHQKAPFHIGKRVLNSEVYSDIRKSFIEMTGSEAWEKKKNLLHFYRE